MELVFTAALLDRNQVKMKMQKTTMKNETVSVQNFLHLWSNQL